MVLTWDTGVETWWPACRCIGCANQAPDAAEPDKPQKAARLAPAATEPLSAPGTRAAPAQAQAAVGEAASFRVQRLEQRRAAAAAPIPVEWWPVRKPARATPPAERFLLPEAYMLKGAAKCTDGEHVWPALPCHFIGFKARLPYLSVTLPYLQKDKVSMQRACMSMPWGRVTRCMSRAKVYRATCFCRGLDGQAWQRRWHERQRGGHCVRAQRHAVAHARGRAPQAAQQPLRDRCPFPQHPRRLHSLIAHRQGYAHAHSS